MKLGINVDVNLSGKNVGVLDKTVGASKRYRPNSHPSNPINAFKRNKNHKKPNAYSKSGGGNRGHPTNCSSGNNGSGNCGHAMVMDSVLHVTQHPEKSDLLLGWG